MLSIPALEKLVAELARLPGIGNKSAQRMAYHVLKADPAYAHRLSSAIERVRAEVHECPTCFNFTDRDQCVFCTDAHRSDDVLCVVEEPSDILRIDASGAFRGRFHVLHGSLAPLDGVGPDDLKIRELLRRLDQAEEAGRPVREIILALDADLEGDTTALYLAKMLKERASKLPVRLSRIAHGVPIGSDIDFVDDRTMGRALENRVEL